MSETTEIIKVVGAIVSPLIMAYVGVIQAKISKRQQVIHKQIDGQQELLMTAVASKNFAEGKLEGKQEKKVDDKEVKAVQIVGQDKPVEVVNKDSFKIE